MSDYGHWDLKFVGNFDPKDFSGFVYKAVDLISGKVYIGRKFFWKKNGDPSNWKRYKTSSSRVNELVKKRPFKFYIMELLETRKSTIETEIKYLRERQVTSFPERYYNRAINSEEYYRDEESYSNPKFRENISKATKSWIKERGHPLLGKTHPNRGKKLPQTSAKEHVSVNNFQITNGKENRFHPKNEEIPDGWWGGSTQKKNLVATEKQIQACMEMSRKNRERALVKYYTDPNSCVVCGKILDYDERHRKTCASGACYSKLRLDVTKRTFNKQTSEKSIETRKYYLAKEKGFNSYNEYMEAIVDFYRTHTNDKTREKFNCSKTQILSACKHVGFSKRVSKIKNT